MADEQTNSTFSRSEKLAAVAREIALRRRNYPKWVASGKMNATAAEREIAIMIEIAKDYGGHG